MYAVGWTMHTVGSQIIRTAAILQLLLGNIGRPGGGINALRGHANVQGATDHAIVAGILPGYLKVPTPPQTSLASHLGESTPRPLVPDTVNYWGNYPKFYVSQMKAWFGDHATRANDFAYDYLAKQDGDATWLTIWDKVRQGSIDGFVALGFNPLLAGPDVPPSARLDVEAQVEGGHRPLHARLGRVLEGAGHGPGGDRHRGALPAVLPLDRARRLVHQQRALGAVEGEGDRPPAGRARRHLDPVGALLAREGAVSGRGRRLERGDPEPDVGLSEPSRADDGRAGEGDQRLRPGERAAALVVRRAGR